MEVTGIVGVDTAIVEILSIIATVLASFIGYYLRKLALKLKEKYDIEIENQKLIKAQEVATQFILAAEELAVTDPNFREKATALARNLYERYDDMSEQWKKGKEKLAWTITKIMRTIPGISQEEAEDLATGLIPTLHTAGIGGVAKRIREAIRE